MTALAATSFGFADWIVLAAYLALLVGTGVWFSRREQKTTSDYFLAGRKMPMWAVAVSIIATSLSAATFVGAPEQSYKGDLTYLSTNIGGLIAVVIVAWFFIPAFYRNNCTTVYELLERRFGTGSKHATSAAFMVGRLFASGARIYIAAIPLSMILFGADIEKSQHYELCMILSIAALMVVGTVYALFGGISGVIWTDVIQTVVLVVAVVAAIAVLWHKIELPPWRPNGIAGVVEALRDGVPSGERVAGTWGKLTILRPGLKPHLPDYGFDPSAQFTLLTAVCGFALLNIAAYGTDHDLVQRMLTCRNAIQGGKSVLWSMVIGTPLVASFLVVGLLLYLFYNRPATGYIGASALDLIWNSQRHQPDSRHIFVGFILNIMPPGLRALMLAGLFAAGVGSLTSAINAMAATLIKDFYTKLAPNRGERHYLAMSKLAVLGWGLALGVFAVLCLYWQKASPQTTLIGLALGVMTFAYAGLLAVFLTALFTKRGSTASVIAALLTGFVVIALLQDWAWPHWTRHISADLANIKLAFPWHMTIGTVIAFGVCCLGKRPAARSPNGPQELRCEQCGYDLTGLRGTMGASVSCPECGAPTTNGEKAETGDSVAPGPIDVA
ncbi:MAG TPA: sodium:solute symporter [Phycisphaerales bacterium]|nr:sodium:solute symporter [Phycisphaerales bacterium]